MIAATRNTPVRALCRGLALAATVFAFVPAPASAQQVGQQAVTLDDLAFRQAIATVAAQDRDLADFYRERGYDPLWVGADDLARRRALVAAFEATGDHALPAGRYDPRALVADFGGVRTLRDLGRVEVETTRRFLAYARDIHSGALEPRSIDPGLVMELPRPEVPALLAGIAEAQDPARFLRGLAPQDPGYTRLMGLRKRLIETQRAGGWGPPVTDVQALKPGMEGPAVVALRDRLIRMDYLPMRASARYDVALQRAVQRFQLDHGLTADGVAGADTLAAINQPVATRLAQVAVGLERLRWLNKPLGKRHILVNQAAFQMQIVEDGLPVFESDVIVGMANEKWRTPEFSDEMDHMMVNPTWHVPASIAARDYLPKMMSNPNAASYLRIYDASGRQISRSSIDFSRYSVSNFPFSLKQPPSDSNALGLVKFMFPNRWNIYLHDTPTKHLFGQETRAFSSGCVRVQRPFDLAYELLSRQTSDPKGTFHRALDSGVETRIDIRQPVPVHLTYRTLWVDARGRTQIRDDVYGRDARIAEALLAAGVRFSQAES